VTLLTRFIVAFFIIALGALSLSEFFGVEFGTVSFWKNHGVFFLIFIALFPRLTLLFSSVASGGLVWWLAWIVAPRFLVAVLATHAYAYTNPYLVTFAWLIAFGGESSEKVFVAKRFKKKYKKTSNRVDLGHGDTIETTATRVG
jgi:hypothetical protein